GLKLLHHPDIPISAVLLEARESIVQDGALGVDKVAKEVESARRVGDRQLDTWYELDSELAGGLGSFAKPVERVVIRYGQRREALLGRQRDELRGCQRAIRGGGVRVEVDGLHGRPV